MSAQSADNLQTIQTRHGDIDDGNIRRCFPHQSDGFSAVGRFCNDLHIVAFFNDAAKPGPDNTVVICQKDLNQSKPPLSEAFSLHRMVEIMRKHDVSSINRA
jgi:hypothetical protein